VLSRLLRPGPGVEDDGREQGYLNEATQDVVRPLADRCRDDADPVDDCQGDVQDSVEPRAQDQDAKHHQAGDHDIGSRRQEEGLVDGEPANQSSLDVGPEVRTVVLATHAFSAVDAYVFGFVLSELNLPMEPGESAEEFVQGIGLLTEAYPYLAEMLAEQVLGKNFSYADEFDYGLELILDGLEERLGSVARLRS
jgi:Tetracyclin repressor-like, C-terminal domain